MTIDAKLPTEIQNMLRDKGGVLIGHWEERDIRRFADGRYVELPPGGPNFAADMRRMFEETVARVFKGRPPALNADGTERQ